MLLNIATILGVCKCAIRFQKLENFLKKLYQESRSVHLTFLKVFNVALLPTFNFTIWTKICSTFMKAKYSIRIFNSFLFKNSRLLARFPFFSSFFAQTSFSVHALTTSCSFSELLLGAVKNWNAILHASSKDSPPSIQRRGTIKMLQLVMARPCREKLQPFLIVKKRCGIASAAAAEEKLPKVLAQASSKWLTIIIISC